MRQKCEWIEKKESDWAGHLTGGFKAMKEWVAGRTVEGIKECRRVGLGLYMDGKGMNCLSLGDCVWCDVCEEAMGKSTESESENEAVSDGEGEIEEEECEMDVEGYESEMDVEELGNEMWSESTIDGLKENRSE